MAFKPVGLLVTILLSLAAAGPALAMDGIGGGTGGTGGAPSPTPGLGQFYASLQTALADGSEALRAALLGRARGGEDGFKYWGLAHAESGSRSPDGLAELDERGGGVLFGFDFGLPGDWRLGGAGGFQNSSPESGAAGSSAEIETWQAGVYGAGPAGPVTLAFGVGYEGSQADVRRVIVTSGVPDPYRAQMDAETTVAFIEASHAIPVGDLTIEPFVSGASISVRTDRVSEVGAAAALDVEAGEFRTEFSEVGVRIAVPLHGLNATAGLAWRHALGDDAPVAMLTLGATPFSSAGAPMEQDEAEVEVGLAGPAGEFGRWSLTYAGAFGEQRQDQRLALRISGPF